jgi:hypothetical protein
MIGNVNALGKGFKGVSSYLESGKDGQQLDRVDWIETRNLPTRDPQSAARIMAATARDSTKTERAVYHFSISFDPGDWVDREAMRRVADRTLRDLGLQDHQALIVAHRDTAHPHVHVVVNRVNPETGRAWSNFRDYPRIEKSLRAQEVEMGLRVVPGKHARVPERDGAALARGPAPRVARGDAAFLRDVQERAAPVLRRARSWAEVERGLAEQGLAVRVNGRGMSVTDGRQQVKASEVDRAFSRKHLEERFGPWHNHRARVAVAELPTPARDTPRPTPAPTPAARAHPEPAPIPPRKAEHLAARRSYAAALERLYEQPGEARRALHAAVLRDGREKAVRTLRERPEAFGRVRAAPAPVPERAAEAAREAFRWTGRAEASGRIGAQQAASYLRAYVAGERYSAARDAVEDARLRAQYAPFQRTYIRNHVDQLRTAAPSVYENPRAALWQIARSVREHGASRTADLIRHEPERFGALCAVERSRYFGIVRELDDSAARAEAWRVASPLQGLDFNLERRERVGQVIAARNRLAHAEATLAKLSPPHARGGEHALRQAGKILHTLERAGVDVAAKVAPMLPGKGQAIAVVKKALELGRDLVLGRDRERDRGGR